MKILEDQNHNLMENNQKIEDEYRNVLAFKTLMDSYKDQVAMLETKNRELVREKNKLEYDYDQQAKKIELFEADKVRDEERIQSLEDQLQETQLGMNPIIERPNVEGGAAVDNEYMDIDDYDLNDNLEDALKESNVTELKLSKRRLERQVKKLQEEKSAGGGQKVVVLQHLLEDANRLKAKFEKNYLDVSQERDILQSDMARIREGIPDALVDQSSHTLSLRLRINDLEKEIKSLNATIEKLEKRISEGRFTDTDDDMRNRFSEMESRSKELEEKTKQQLQDINKLLLEKDMLQGQSIEQKDLLLEKERLNSEMKASLAAIEAKDGEALTMHYTRLQAEHLALQEKHAGLKAKLKNSQNVNIVHPFFFLSKRYSLPLSV